MVQHENNCTSNSAVSKSEISISTSKSAASNSVRLK